jgi:DegV family protein with EDD domain
MMEKVKIMTDSTSDIPLDFAKQLGIEILPVNLVLDDKTYKDSFEITSQEFYQNFDSYNDMYSQPVPYEDYALKYKQVASENKELIIIHCSKKLSETYNIALKVHEDFRKSHRCKVTIIDSKQGSLGLGLMVIAAAKAAAQKKSSGEIISLVKRHIQNTSTFFGVPHLKYLRKGKKISGFKSLIGTAMGLKPVLAVNKEGMLELKSKLFGEHRNMMLEMLDFIREDIDKHYIDLGIAHANALDIAEELRDVFKAQFKCRQILISFVSPALGSRTGPGSIGLMYYKYSEKYDI